MEDCLGGNSFSSLQWSVSKRHELYLYTGDSLLRLRAAAGRHTEETPEQRHV